MGLLQAIVDEIIPFPKQCEYEYVAKNEMNCTYRFGYSFLNLIFEFVDCIIIPNFTYLLLIGALHFGSMNWLLIIIGFCASCFSLFQFIYYFIFPTDKYVNPVTGRLLGETAVGSLISSIFKIKIKTYMK